MKKLFTSLATASLLFAPAAQAFETHRSDYEFEGKRVYAIESFLELGDQKYVFVDTHYDADGTELFAVTHLIKCDGSIAVSWDSAVDYGYSYKKYADIFCSKYAR